MADLQAPGKPLTLWDRMTIDLPEGEVDGLRVKKFEIKPFDRGNLRQALRMGRGTKPGWYTKLVDCKTKTLWMSDTDAEKSDHFLAVRAIEFSKAERVMINGLGLGMVLNAALSFNHVTQVDVVERDERVIKLIGSHYTKDPRVVIHHADAWDQRKQWPKGTRWDVGWSDIWSDVNPENLREMATMNRSYGGRCGWHRCWAQDTLQRMRRQERAEERRCAEFFS